MKVIKSTEDKSIRPGKIFQSQVHIKEITKQLKNRLSISSTCNLHRKHMEQRGTPLFWTSKLVKNVYIEASKMPKS